MITSIGAVSIASVRGLGAFLGFVLSSLRGFGRTRRVIPRLLRSTVEQGTRCLPVIVIVGGFTGLVLGLQGKSTEAEALLRRNLPPDQADANLAWLQARAAAPLAAAGRTWDSLRP